MAARMSLSQLPPSFEPKICIPPRLRLAIYKGIGFEPILNRDGKLHKILISEYTSYLVPRRMLKNISEAQSGDLHTVDFTTGKTDAEYTQLLWKLVNS